MFKYIRQRIAFAILALFIISIFSFIMISAFGPNPVKAVAEKDYSSGTIHIPFDEYLRQLEVKFGFRYGTEQNPGEKIPLIVRYFTYIGNIFKKGDFGFVIDSRNNPNAAEFTTMAKLFFYPLRYSLLITVPAFIMSSIIGITLGVFAGYNRGKIFDSFINVFVYIFIALPSFIIAPIVITIAAKINILSAVPEFGEQPFGVVLLAYMPPILVITLASLAVYTIYTRNQVITVLTSNYILIAKSKGLSKSQVFFKYVLRNISIPLFSLIISSFIGLLSGSIIIEKFWNIKGTSQVITNAFPKGEIYVVMYSIQFFTLISLFSEIFIDIMFAVLDPRIKYGVKSKKNYWLFFKAYLVRRKLEKDLFAMELANNNSEAMKGVK